MYYAEVRRNMCVRSNEARLYAWSKSCSTLDAAAAIVRLGNKPASHVLRPAAASYRLVSVKAVLQRSEYVTTKQEEQ
jgi:hypothetical protein